MHDLPIGPTVAGNWSVGCVRRVVSRIDDPFLSSIIWNFWNVEEIESRRAQADG